jgi:hypothetical protein
MSWSAYVRLPLLAFALVSLATRHRFACPIFFFHIVSESSCQICEVGSASLSLWNLSMDFVPHWLRTPRSDGI